MRSIFLTSLLALLFAACASEPRDEGAAGGPDDDDTAGDTSSPGGKPSGDSATARPPESASPGSAADDEDSSGKSNEFEECAETRADAERGPRGTNVVWVVDNSGSMDEEAAVVQENMNRFVESIVAAGLSDYRVVLITEEDFVRVPDPLGSDSARFLKVEEEVGSEEPLSDLLSRFSSYMSFLLPGVVTHFIVVTDDESEITASSFVTDMKSRLGGDFRVHSIASPPGEMPPSMPSSIFDDDDDDSNGCVGGLGEAAEPGVQHWEASKLTDGLTFSICSDDWSVLFGELAKEVGESAAVPCTVELPEPPASMSLDLGRINVLYTPPGASAGDKLPKVDDAAACGTELGWHYDKPTGASRIVLCPSSCEAASMGGSLEIALGCQTVLI